MKLPVQPENPVIQCEWAGNTKKKAMSAKLLFNQENPVYTGVVEAKGTQEEGHVGEASSTRESV